MNKKICKYCGEEINTKAEICPKCGCRVKSNGLKIFLISIGTIIGFILFVILCLFIFRTTKKVKENNHKDMFVGTWNLQQTENILEEPSKYKYVIVDDNKRVLLDDTLTFERKDVFWHLGGDRYCEKEGFEKIDSICAENPTVHIAYKEDEIAIDFLDEYGYAKLLCFKLIDENTLKQISCTGIALDDINSEGFAINGGVIQDLGIVYKKVN